MKQIITKSAVETKGLAKKIASKLKGGDILALVGDLGGGKTTFVKGLAEGFGIKEVQSPTFTLIRECKRSKQLTDNSKQVKKIYHIDVYRLQSEKEAEELGLEELFQEKDAIFVIEWADKIKSLLPKNAKWIEFDFIDENTRRIIQNSKVSACG